MSLSFTPRLVSPDRLVTALGRLMPTDLGVWVGAGEAPLRNRTVESFSLPSRRTKPGNSPSMRSEPCAVRCPTHFGVSAAPV